MDSSATCYPITILLEEKYLEDAIRNTSGKQFILAEFVLIIHILPSVQFKNMAYRPTVHPCYLIGMTEGNKKKWRKLQRS